MGMERFNWRRHFCCWKRYLVLDATGTAEFKSSFDSYWGSWERNGTDPTITLRFSTFRPLDIPHLTDSSGNLDVQACDITWDLHVNPDISRRGWSLKPKSSWPFHAPTPEVVFR